MARKKVEQLVIDTSPRRVRDKEINVAFDMPCTDKLIKLIEYLNILLVQYGDDASIDLGHSYDGYDSYFKAILTSFRDETPKEIEKRIAKTKKDKERALIQQAKRKEKTEKEKEEKVQNDLEMLRRLKEKYEGYDIQNVNKEG